MTGDYHTPAWYVIRHPESSPVGIGLTTASLLVMPLLGWRKRRVGTLLGNPLVRGRLYQFHDSVQQRVKSLVGQSVELD